LDENDPAAHMAMEGSLLRSSLLTSVLAFGVAASEIALGAMFVGAGVAISILGRRTCSPGE
jgi:hypothetical protein